MEKKEEKDGFSGFLGCAASTLTGLLIFGGFSFLMFMLAKACDIQH